MPKSQKKPAPVEQSPIIAKPKRVIVIKSLHKAAALPKPSKRTLKQPVVALPEITAGLSKQAAIIVLLRRTEGATMDNLVTATGWQQHSVRGVISGVLKKRLGLGVISEMQECGRVYRIAGNR